MNDLNDRSDRTVIGYQRWADILFLHWPVPADALRALVPPALSIDTFEGQAYLSATPFTLEGGRLRGVPPVPGASTFHEVNLRTYVTKDGRNPGLWFFSLDAASGPAVVAARAALRLPYYWSNIERGLAGDHRTYFAERRRPASRPATLSASWSVGEPAGTAAPASLDAFLVERYRLYASWYGGAVYEIPVAHPSWPLRKVSVSSAVSTLAEAAGLGATAGAPLAHYSDGVDVEFFRPAPAR